MDRKLIDLKNNLLKSNPHKGEVIINTNDI